MDDFLKLNNLQEKVLVFEYMWKVEYCFSGILQSLYEIGKLKTFYSHFVDNRFYFPSLYIYNHFKFLVWSGKNGLSNNFGGIIECSLS